MRKQITDILLANRALLVCRKNLKIFNETGVLFKDKRQNKILVLRGELQFWRISRNISNPSI